jgi:hypothetical protein
VSLEVVMHFPGGNEDCIQHLMDLQVPGFGLMEDFADVVHQTLDGPHPPGGSGASVSIGIGLGSS